MIGRIDFCFVTEANIGVIKHNILDEKIDGVNYSDHYAVMIKYAVINN